MNESILNNPFIKTYPFTVTFVFVDFWTNRLIGEDSSPWFGREINYEVKLLGINNSGAIALINMN